MVKMSTSSLTRRWWSWLLDLLLMKVYCYSPVVAENVPKVVPAVPVSVPQSMPTVKERPMPSQGTIIAQPGPAMKNHLGFLLE